MASFETVSSPSSAAAEPIPAIRSADWLPIYAAIALTSLATLLLELSITRLFSVLLYYHFAFLAISIAMFGLGAGGVLSYGIAKRKAPRFGIIGGILLINAVVVVCALIFILTREGRLGIGTLFEFYFATTIPFLGVGVVLSIAISETIDRVDRVYFADLLGAGASCLVLIPLLNHLGGPSTIITSGFLYAASAVIWYRLADKPRIALWASGIAAGLFILAIYNVRRDLRGRSCRKPTLAIKRKIPYDA